MAWLESLFRRLASWRLWLLFWSLFVLALPALPLAVAMTIIGLPLAILMTAMPAAAFVLLPASLIARRLEARAGTIPAWAAGLAVVISISALVAAGVNWKLDRDARALIAGDFSRIEGAAPKRIALVTDHLGGRGDTSLCEGLCLRLLLNGHVEEVLLAGGDEAKALPVGATAVAVRLDRRSACAPLRVPDNDITLDGESRNAPKIARRRIAFGECLSERTARLGDADAAIVFGALKSGKTDFSAGVNLFADTVRASRIAYWRREKEGFAEAHRRTRVIVQKHPPILVLTVVPGGGFDARAAFLRITERRGYKHKYEEEIDVAGFVEDALGLPLRLSRDAAPDASVLVDGVLSRDAAPTRAETEALEDFLASLSASPTPAVSRDDAVRAAAILNRFDIELSFSAVGAMYAIGEAHADLAPAIVTAQFQRLFATAPDARESRYNDPYVRRIAGVIAAAPESAVLAHRADFDRLAADAERRGYAAQLLAKYHVFGAAAAPALLELIDAAIALGERSERHDDRWRDLYRAGLSSLCQIGDPSVRIEIEGRLDASPDLQRWPHQELLIHTLIRLGADPAALLAELTTAADENEARNIADEIERAKRRPKCGY
jgi:hypothetical protein